MTCVTCVVWSEVATTYTTIEAMEIVVGRTSHATLEVVKPIGLRGSTWLRVRENHRACQLWHRVATCRESSLLPGVPSIRQLRKHFVADYAGVCREYRLILPVPSPQPTASIRALWASCNDCIQSSFQHRLHLRLQRDLDIPLRVCRTRHDSSTTSRSNLILPRLRCPVPHVESERPCELGVGRRTHQ